MNLTHKILKEHLAAGIIVAGDNYGQGSSREHAAITPMYLGVRVVTALSYARIHESNLVNFGIPPLRFTRHEDYGSLEQGDSIEVPGISKALSDGNFVRARNVTRGLEYELSHGLSSRQIDMLLAGGLTRYLKRLWSRGAAA